MSTRIPPMGRVKESPDGQRRVIQADYRTTRQNPEKVPLIIADPPYNLGLADWDVDFDFGPLVDVIAEKLDANGSALIFNTYDNVLALHNLAVQAGLVVQQLLIWVKPNFPPRYVRTKGYVDKNREYILWVSRKTRPFFQLKPDERYHTGVFTYPRVVNKTTRFLFEKPAGLIDELLLRHSQPGDHILDLFAGSGIVGKRCQCWRRRYTGYERDPETFGRIELT
ncbi:MAG: site-specific DNA-methyltransferase [Sporolactobacillus sp.]